MGTEQWLAYAREIFTLAQAGLTYNAAPYRVDPFDLERYKRLREISAEIIAHQSELADEEVLASFTVQQGYPTPKVDVRGAIVQNGHILLVQELADGRWSMPGGWADLGESAAEMVTREVREESGYEVRIDKLVAVFNNHYVQPYEFFHSYKLVFLCSIVGGSARGSYETQQVGFFPLDQLPELSTSRTNQRILDEVMAHVGDPNRSTFYE